MVQFLTHYSTSSPYPFCQKHRRRLTRSTNSRLNPADSRSRWPFRTAVSQIPQPQDSDPLRRGSAAFDKSVPLSPLVSRGWFPVPPTTWSWCGASSRCSKRRSGGRPWSSSRAVGRATGADSAGRNSRGGVRGRGRGFGARGSGLAASRSRVSLSLSGRNISISGNGSRSWRRSATSPDTRTRHHVRLGAAGPDIVCDARILSTVCTGELDQRAWGAGAAAGDAELGALCMYVSGWQSRDSSRGDEMRRRVRRTHVELRFTDMGFVNCDVLGLL
jgi:hypothetical protein